VIGEKIRQTRISQNLSLADVAHKAKISVATLSRIETDKQTLELGMFLTLARVLNVTANELLASLDIENSPSGSLDPLVKKIAGFAARERTQLWRDLAVARRGLKTRSRGGDVRHVSQQVEELLAQIDFMREELDNVRKRLRRTSA
jgi:transcriptional regulator with XRE-family HTH domain